MAEPLTEAILRSHISWARETLDRLRLTPEGQKLPHLQEPAFRLRVKSYEGFIREAEGILSS